MIASRKSETRDGAADVAMLEEISLEAYRVKRELTWKKLAALIGATSPRQAWAWAKGEERPSNTRIAEIERATHGEVGRNAMFKTRLAWEREHKPPAAGLALPASGSRAA